MILRALPRPTRPKSCPVRPIESRVCVSLLPRLVVLFTSVLAIHTRIAHCFPVADPDEILPFDAALGASLTGRSGDAEAGGSVGKDGKPMRIEAPPGSRPLWRAIKLNAPEWPYFVLGLIGAIIAGLIFPVFLVSLRWCGCPRGGGMDKG